MDELYMDAGNPNPLYGEEMINNYRNNVDPELVSECQLVGCRIERHGFQYAWRFDYYRW